VAKTKTAKAKTVNDDTAARRSILSSLFVGIVALLFWRGSLVPTSRPVNDGVRHESLARVRATPPEKQIFGESLRGQQKDRWHPCLRNRTSYLQGNSEYEHRWFRVAAAGCTRQKRHSAFS